MLSVMAEWTPLSHWFQISASCVEVHNSACFTIMLLLMLTRNKNYNPEIVKWMIKNKSRVKMKEKVQRMMWKKKLALASCVPWVLCDACTTPPLSSCTQFQCNWIHLPIRKPWESGCAVPNHSYNIGNVELPLNKGVCKELLAKYLPLPSR